MFFQQKLSSATQMSSSSEQQKMMLILFPIIFVFIFYNMPAGLVLYWLVNNILMLVQQVRMNRIKKTETVS
jgi:YidC/Oxa1 family membrane protein insertase